MSTEARLDFEHNASWDPIHDGAILSMCICPDGRYLASGGADGRLIVWDTSSGEPLHRIDANSPILCMTWMELSGDDTKLFCGLQSGTLLEASVAEVRIFLSIYRYTPFTVRGYHRGRLPIVC